MDMNEMAVRLQQVDDRTQRNEARIAKLETSQEALKSLATSVAVLAERQNTTNENLETLTEKVDSIEGKPAERWDKLVSAIIGTLAGAFIAWIAAGMTGI